MFRMLSVAAIAAVSLAAPVAAAQTVVYNANPNTPFTYGSGNDYKPANAAVLTNGNLELASRFHINKKRAEQSVGAGVYSFALGTDKINFDYSAVNYGSGPVTVKLTNLMTGRSASYTNSFLFPDDNGSAPGYQQSQQLGFAWFNGIFGDIDFDANVNNTYRFDLTAGGSTLTTYAKVGSGFAAAVPEPATWAMLIMGFGVAGTSMRSRRKLAVRFA